MVVPASMFAGTGAARSDVATARAFPASGPSEPPGRELDDRAFLEAARLVDRALAHGLGRATAGTVLREPRATLRAFRLLRDLPRLDLRLTTDDVGRTIAARLQTRERGMRPHALAQAVLVVPDDPVAYLRGRPRQGLRNKLSKARTMGVRAEPATSDEGLLADKEICLARPGAAELEDDWPIQPDLLTWFVARGPDDAPLAVMCVIEDRDVTLIKVFHAIQDSPLSSPARHALHQELVRYLSARSCRYLVGDSALRATPGIRVFLHGLGYRAWHLQIAGGPGA